MQPAVLIRLRPAGPWRYGPGDGGRTRVDSLFRSDRLFSALTLAAKQLAFLEDWLDATASSSSPALAFSSLYPFQGDVLFVTPPANLWPPPLGLVTSPSPVFLTKVRWSAAKFVPVGLVETILTGQKVLADQWAPDPESACLLRRDRPSTTPFRTVVRTGAAVDRITKQSSSAYSFAGVEFEPGAGLWTVVQFADESASQVWMERIKGMFRLLADTGLGGRRSVGWGQMEAPEFEDGLWPAVLFPRLARALAKNGTQDDAQGSSLYWLMSLFAPGATDAVDWSGGDYNLIERNTISGKQVRLIAEGSVVAASAAPVGNAVDVAEGQAGHPVYKSGIALSLKLPSWPEPIPEEATIEPVPEIVVIEPLEEPIPMPDVPVPEVPVPAIHDPEMPIVVSEAEPERGLEEPQPEPVVELPELEKRTEIAQEKATFEDLKAEPIPDVHEVELDAEVSEKPAGAEEVE
jgi:CRISPR type III-A-associated RAMP protein Csm4